MWDDMRPVQRMLLPFFSRMAGMLSGEGKRGRLFILIYHRVLDEKDPMRKSELDVTEFQTQMELLSRHFNVFPLSQGIQHLKEGTLPERAVSITFDDGYRDNYNNALPVLESLGISATFFVATGFLSRGRMWNDTVIETFRSTRKEVVSMPDIGLHDVRLLNQESRADAAEQAIHAIKHLPFDERARWVNEISQLASGLPDDLMMDIEQVHDMHCRGMEIGAHTVNHPILAKLDDEMALQEIQQGKTELEDIVQAPVKLFAYPNGKYGIDYTERDMRLVEQCGFDAAVSTNPGASDATENLFALRRFTPWDKTPIRFMLRMIQYYRRPS